MWEEVGEEIRGEGRENRGRYRPNIVQVTAKWHFQKFLAPTNTLKFTCSKVETQKFSGGNTPGPPLQRRAEEGRGY